MEFLRSEGERGTSGKMTEVYPAFEKWGEMGTDVLVKIFGELNIIELSHVSQVCQLWRKTSSDPLLWGALDLGLLKSNFIQTPSSPYIWVDERSDRKLIQLLRTAMSLSHGNITCLIFHFNLYMKDDHLNLIAEGCPHLKRLVLPAWNRITKTGICQAVRRWKELESLTMPSIAHPPYIIEEISRSCENFSTLKIMGTFNLPFALTVASNLPKLKVLSIRCSMLTKEALLFILDHMDHLEILNISHCMLLDSLTNRGMENIAWELDHGILVKTRRLKEFYYCMNVSCATCQRMVEDEGLMRWYRYEESFWREDEVRLLALGENYGKLFDEGCMKLGCTS